MSPERSSPKSGTGEFVDVDIWLTPEELEDLDDFCRENGLTHEQAVRKAWKHYLILRAINPKK